MPEWRKYENQIHQKFRIYFPTCHVRHDDKIKGKFSRVDRQVDISIKTKLEGLDILGVVECKCFSQKLDVKVVDCFIGFMKDVGADFGYIVTNQGFSKAAQNRTVEHIRLKIIEFSHIDEYQFVTVDELINERIKALECIEPVFMIRQRQRSRYVDLNRTDFTRHASVAMKRLVFKTGFAKTEYFAYKKLLEETARVFRDFPTIERIQVVIPSDYEGNIYSSDIEKLSLEDFLGVHFAEIQQDIKAWRGFLGGIRKPLVRKFAAEYVKKEPLSQRPEGEIEPLRA